MSIKRLSLRFNLEKEDERKAWEYLQKQLDSKNQTIIKAINDMANFWIHWRISAEVSGITLMPLFLYSEGRWHHCDATTQERRSTMQKKQEAENGFRQSTRESYVAYCNKQKTCTASSNSESASLLIHSLGNTPNSLERME